MGGTRRARLVLPDADLVTEPQNALGSGSPAEAAGCYRHPFIHCYRSFHASATIDSANTWSVTSVCLIAPFTVRRSAEPHAEGTAPGIPLQQLPHPYSTLQAAQLPRDSYGLVRSVHHQLGNVGPMPAVPIPAY